jgi:hypothetical protein
VSAILGKARATHVSIRRLACLLTFVIAALVVGMAQDQQQPPAEQPSPNPTDTQQQSQPPSPAQASPKSADQTQSPPTQEPANPKPTEQQSQTPVAEPTNPQQTSPQTQNPDEKQSDEKKDENANPAQAVKDATIQAAQATEKLGQYALVKATDWEGSWFTGVFIPKGAERTPLNVNERRELYLEQTLTTPGAYMKRMFAAGIDQARGVPYQWDDGWAGYTERFASREGQFIAANSLAALGNAALKYEPRYDRCRCSGFWPRTWHAVMRNFLTYDKSETALRPQWALYVGAFGGGVISTAWKPKPRNALADGGRSAAEQGGYGVALNVFIEFAGEINRKIREKTNPNQKF